MINLVIFQQKEVPDICTPPLNKEIFTPKISQIILKVDASLLKNYIQNLWKNYAEADFRVYKQALSPHYVE